MTYDEWARAGFPLDASPFAGRPADREGSPAAVVAATRPLAELLWASAGDEWDDEWEDDDDG